MAIRYFKSRAVLEGQVAVEEAEALAQWLAHQRRPAVALHGCEHVHAAVLQVLLALRPRIATAPPDARLARLLGVERRVTKDNVKEELR